MIAQMTSYEPLSSLLRGELAAIQSYEYAASRLEGLPQEISLHRILHNHRQAAACLRQHLIDQGGEPAREAGPWMYLTSISKNTDALPGPQSTLAALRRGEENAIHLFKEAADKGLPSEECVHLVLDRLLPQTRAHVSVLRRLTHSIGLADAAHETLS